MGAAAPKGASPVPKYVITLAFLSALAVAFAAFASRFASKFYYYISSVVHASEESTVLFPSHCKDMLHVSEFVTGHLGCLHLGKVLVLRSF